MRLLFALVILLPSVASAQIPDSYPFDFRSTGIKVPKVDDPELQKRLNDALYYKLAPVWQHYIPASRIKQEHEAIGSVTYKTQPAKWGIHSFEYLAKFNANRDFPWEGTVGFNSLIAKGETENLDTINFLSLPRENGKRLPVLIVYETPIKWIFPAGTIVGEIIYTRHKGRWWAQEIRAREKDSDSLIWEPIVFRPVRNREELCDLVFKGNEYATAKQYMHFRNPEEDEVFRLDGMIERLPPLSERTVESLLSRTFTDVTFEPWSDVSHAPCSDQDFSIFPREYSFGLIQPDSTNCQNCHRQTQTSVRNLIPREPLIQNNFEKVGNIRGSDSVFSWHPFHANSVKDSDTVSPTAILRKYDEDNDIVRVWDSRRDAPPGDRYKLTEFVQQSLKPYELPNKVFLHKDAPEKIEYKVILTGEHK